MEKNITYHMRINAVKNELHNKNEIRIFKFIQSRKEDIIHMSVSEAAEACKVSKAAMVRYAQKLGYKGYQAMKINIAQETIEPEKQIYGKLVKTDTIKSIMNKIISSHIQALKDTLRVLDDSAIEQAIKYILHANQLLFMGIGGAGSVAQDGQHKFMKIGRLAHFYADYNLQTMAVSTLSSKDVIIVISHSGDSMELLNLLEIASHSNVKIIAITNYSKSSIVELADVSLFTYSDETAVNSDALSSRIAELAILDILYIGVVFKTYRTSYEHIVTTRTALASTKI
jgi:RpiR family carbohydrate utilization transcriptional regulator